MKDISKLKQRDQESIHKTIIKKWGCENTGCKWSNKGICKRLNIKEKCVMPGERKIPSA